MPPRGPARPREKVPRDPWRIVSEGENVLVVLHAMHLAAPEQLPGTNTRLQEAAHEAGLGTAEGPYEVEDNKFLYLFRFEDRGREAAERAWRRFEEAVKHAGLDVALLDFEIASGPIVREGEAALPRYVAG